MVKKRKEYQRAYRAANKEKLKEIGNAYREDNKEKIKETLKAYKEANKEKIKEYRKAYEETNREKISATSKAWYKANPKKERGIRKKILSTPEGKLIQNMRIRIYKIIKINHKIKNKHTLELLGCDGKFLKKHLEKQFSKGMSWGNYGEWHVDHIIPIDYFLKNHDFNNIEVQKECFNYSNLQPLWGLKNMKKRNKISKFQQIRIN